MAPNGTRIFLAEQSQQLPVGIDIHLGVEQAQADPPGSVDVVFNWTDTHWGTQVMTVRDPRWAPVGA